MEFGKVRAERAWRCERCPKSRLSKERRFVTEWITGKPVRRVFCERHYRDYVREVDGVQLPLTLPFSNTGVNNE